MQPLPPQSGEYVVDWWYKLTYMWAIFKPLFVYKKYQLAHEVLGEACKSSVWVTNSGNEEQYQSEKNFGETYLSVFILTRKNLDTTRLIEAIEILEKNEHLIAHKKLNLYEYSIEITKAGERAFNDGFYMKKLYKHIAAIIGSAIAILSTAIGLIIKYLL